MSNVSIGKIGEDIAKEYLEKHGYKILETNRRFSKYSEIDIIALDKNTLVFIEVKTRKNKLLGSPLEAVTKTKYKHLEQGLYFYLKEKPQYKKFRIDAVGIILQPDLQIEHLKNI